MMSTAEEVKAEMFGDDPFAGHHEVVVGRYSAGRTETGSAVAEYRSQTMWTNWWASLWIVGVLLFWMEKRRIVIERNTQRLRRVAYVLIFKMIHLRLTSPL